MGDENRIRSFKNKGKDTEVSDDYLFVHYTPFFCLKSA